MALIVRLADHRPRPKARRVSFDRTELSQLLALYSGRVAAGEWRDYAIDHEKGMAVFSIFRRTSEKPAFSVCKIINPKGKSYAVFDSNRRLNHSQSLSEALTIFARRPRLVSE